MTGRVCDKKERRGNSATVPGKRNKERQRINEQRPEGTDAWRSQTESLGFRTTKLSELSTEGGTFKNSQTTETACQGKIKTERLPHEQRRSGEPGPPDSPLYRRLVGHLFVTRRGAFADRQPHGTFQSGRRRRRRRRLRSGNTQERKTTKGGAHLEERAEQIAWQTVTLPRQRGEGGMQQEAAGEGGRKWKRRRRKERGEPSICPLMKTGFYV